MMKLLNRIHGLEAQYNLLLKTMQNNNLLDSKILSSIQPKIGKEFTNIEADSQKRIVLRNTRKQLISIAIKEKEQELLEKNAVFNTRKETYVNTLENAESFLEKLEQSSTSQCRKLNEKMNKKVEFHLQTNQEKTTFTKRRSYLKRKKRKPNARQKKKKKAIYDNKQKQKKQKKIQSLVKKIKDENTVVNLSNQEVPDEAWTSIEMDGRLVLYLTSCST